MARFTTKTITLLNRLYTERLFLLIPTYSVATYTHLLPSGTALLTSAFERILISRFRITYILPNGIHFIYYAGHLF